MFFRRLNGFFKDLGILNYEIIYFSEDLTDSLKLSEIKSVIILCTIISNADIVMPNMFPIHLEAGRYNLIGTFYSPNGGGCTVSTSVIGILNIKNGWVSKSDCVAVLDLMSGYCDVSYYHYLSKCEKLFIKGHTNIDNVKFRIDFISETDDLILNGEDDTDDNHVEKNMMITNETHVVIK